MGPFPLSRKGPISLCAVPLPAPLYCPPFSLWPFLTSRSALVPPLFFVCSSTSRSALVPPLFFVAVPTSRSAMVAPSPKLEKV